MACLRSKSQNQGDRVRIVVPMLIIEPAGVLFVESRCDRSGLDYGVSGGKGLLHLPGGLIGSPAYESCLIGCVLGVPRLYENIHRPVGGKVFSLQKNGYRARVGNGDICCRVVDLSPWIGWSNLTLDGENTHGWTAGGWP